MFDAKEFGMRLMEARKLRRMTLEQLAEQIDTTAAAICFWEHGKRIPGVDYVVRMADALNVDIEWLCCVQDVPRRSEAMPW